MSLTNLSLATPAAEPEIEHYVRTSEHHDREAYDYGIHYAYCTCGWEAEGDMVQLDRSIDQHMIDS